MASTTVEPVALERYTAVTPFEELIPSDRLISAHESASSEMYALPSDPPSEPVKATIPSFVMKRTDNFEAVWGMFSLVRTLDPPSVIRTASGKADPASVDAMIDLLVVCVLCHVWWGRKLYRCGEAIPVYIDAGHKVLGA